MKRRINNKGTALDFVFIIMLVFMLVLVIFITFKITTLVGNKTMSLIPSQYSSEINELNNKAINIVDWLFAIVFFAISLISIILAYFIKTHPVLFFLNIFLIFIIIMMAHYIEQIIEYIFEVDTFSDISSDFKKIEFITQNFTTIIFIIITLQALIMYSAMRSDL